MTAACPDCAAPVVGRVMTHADSCPAARGMDRVMDADRAWFAAHPDEDWYTRPVDPAERIERDLPPGGHVVVYQLAPGLRSRHFVGSAFFRPVSA